MALIDEDNTQRPEAGAAQAQTQQQQPGTARPQQRQGSSFLERESMVRSGFSKMANGAAAKNFFDKMAKILIDGTTDMPGYAAHFFDGTSNGLAKSMVIFVKKVSSQEGQVLFHHRVLIENSGNPLQTRDIRDARDGNRLAVPWVTADANDSESITKVVNYITTIYGKSITVDCASSSLYDFVTLEQEHILYNLVANAVQALDGSLDAFEKGRGINTGNNFNVSWFDERDNLSADLIFNPTEVDSNGNTVQGAIGLNGEHIRSDVRVVVTTGRNNNNQSIHDATQELMAVDAYTDLIYDPAADDGDRMINAQYNWLQPPQQFRAQIVITRAAFNSRVTTIEHLLFAMSQINLLIEGQLWAKCFLPTPETRTIGDGHGIGALGLVVPGLLSPEQHAAGKTMLDLNDVQDPMKLKDVLNMAVHQYPNIAYDVVFGDENQHLNDVLLAAADRTPAAMQAIFAACDALTLGQFRNFHSPHDPIFVAEDRKEFFLGRYPNAHGEFRDNRDIDLIHVLNVSRGNIQMINDWISTDEIVDGTEERAMRRCNISRTIYSNFQPKTRVRRLTLTGNALVNLTKALQAANLRIRQLNTNAFNNYRAQGTHQLGRYSYSGAGTSFYNNGYTHSGQQAGFHHQGSGRYN